MNNGSELENGSMFNKDNKRFDEFFTVFTKLNEPLQDFLLQCAKNLIDAQKKL